MPGRPLICLHFYSSHQFAEATLTNSELMAEHLRFKTFPTSSRCLYEKNITSAVVYSTAHIHLRWSARDHLGKCVRFLQKYTVKIQFNYIQVAGISAPLAARKAKTVFSHTPRFPYALFGSQSSANLCNSTGISTLNSFFLCLHGQQLQTGTEELNMEQRAKRLQKYLTLCCCTYLRSRTNSHIPQSCFFTKKGRRLLRKGKLWSFT